MNFFEQRKLEMTSCLKSSPQFLLQLVLLSVLLLSSVMVPDVSSTSTPEKTSIKERLLCHFGCDFSKDLNDFCPDRCPERSLVNFGGVRMPEKRPNRPFSDDLDNFSFDDYLFMKTMGRHP